MTESPQDEPGSAVVPRAGQRDAMSELPEPEEPEEAGPNQMQAAAAALVDKLLRFGIDGAGPWKGAVATAEETLASYQDSEQAIQKLIVTHRMLVGTSGFVTGLGGLATMVMSLPADVISFQILSTRMAAGIAHLRGHDLNSEYVRSMVLVSLLGASGTEVMSKVGIEAGTKAATAALKKLPGHALTRVNQAVGFRLVTKFGQTGVVNLVKVIPLLGGGIGAGVNIAGINVLAGHAKRTFPTIG